MLQFSYQKCVVKLKIKSCFYHVVDKLIDHVYTDNVFKVMLPYLCMNNDNKIREFMHQVFNKITSGLDKILVYIFKKIPQ